MEKKELQLAFYSVYNYLENQRDFDGPARLKAGHAKSFLEEVSKGLSSMVQQQNSAYHTIPPDGTRDTIESIGGNLKKITEADIKGYIEIINEYVKNLRQLESGSVNYASREYHGLRESSKRLSQLMGRS